ncbi:MAG: hypothetical protein H0W64_11440 [Gammaproteobacteria bacterium]|nr:hypothetical protein [Gammaproteobacteria bacterium]
MQRVNKKYQIKSSNTAPSNNNNNNNLSNRKRALPVDDNLPVKRSSISDSLKRINKLNQEELTAVLIGLIKAPNELLNITLKPENVARLASGVFTQMNEYNSPKVIANLIFLLGSLAQKFPELLAEITADDIEWLTMLCLKQFNNTPIFEKKAFWLSFLFYGFGCLAGNESTKHLLGLVSSETFAKLTNHFQSAENIETMDVGKITQAFSFLSQPWVSMHLFEQIDINDYITLIAKLPVKDEDMLLGECIKLTSVRRDSLNTAAELLEKFNDKFKNSADNHQLIAPLINKQINNLSRELSETRDDKIDSNNFAANLYDDVQSMLTFDKFQVHKLNLTEIFKIDLIILDVLENIMIDERLQKSLTSLRTTLEGMKVNLSSSESANGSDAQPNNFQVKINYNVCFFNNQKSGADKFLDQFTDLIENYSEKDAAEKPAYNQLT